MLDKQHTKRSLVWTTLESVGLIAVSFATLIVLSRYLTPTEFGIAALALSVVQILNIPVEIFFHDALVQREQIDRTHFNTAFTLSLGLGIVLCLACWLAGDWFGRFVGEPRAGAALLYMSLSLPAMGIGSTIAARMRREMQFGKLAVVAFFARLFAGIAAMALAMQGAGLWSLVAQQVLYVLAGSVMLWFGATNRPSLGFSRTSFGSMYRFGLSVTSVTTLAFSLQRLFTLMVGTLLGTSAAGYMNFAFRTIDMLRDIVGRAVAPVSMPILARLQNDQAGMRHVYSTAVQLTCAISYPLFLGLLACAPEVIEVVFGSQWLPAAPVFAVFALLTVLYFSRIFAIPTANAINKPHIAIPAAMASLAVIAIGMASVGRNSLAYATAVWAASALIALPIDIWMLRRASGISISEQFRGLPAILLAGGIMVIIIRLSRSAMPEHWAQSTALALMIVVGATCYLGLLQLFNRSLLERLFSLARSALSRPRRQRADGSMP